MQVYCSHSSKAFHKQSNSYTCPLCQVQWYKMDSIPLVVVGYTNDDEVFKANTSKLNTDKFIWCSECKDLLKDTHILCSIKLRWWKFVNSPIFGMHWLSWMHDWNFLKLLRFPICLKKGHLKAYTGNYTYCPRCMTQWVYED